MRCPNCGYRSRVGITSQWKDNTHCGWCGWQAPKENPRPGLHPKVRSERFGGLRPDA